MALTPAATASAADIHAVRTRPYSMGPATTTPTMATASSSARRETALLMPEARPACFSSTDVITVAVSGATLVAMPTLMTQTAGKTVTQYDPSRDRRNNRKPDAAII